MAAIKECFCALYMILAICCTSTTASSSGTGPAVQTCSTGYYCPIDRSCHYPGSNRCTSAQNCTSLDDCNQESNGRYLIHIGHAKLYGSKKRTLFEHRFVIYRGYTYEFGGSYVADPEYKYYNGRHHNSNGITTDGSSYEDAVEFTNSWTEKYNVFTNNCQHFAMVIFLESSSCNEVQGKNEIDVSNWRNIKWS